MGLSGRKEKQRIGDDPRNTKWARNEANPGFKLLSSMGWTPDVKTLGLTGSSSTTMTTWKKSPSGALPVIKSNTSGIGANPNMASSYNGIGGAPCFVSSSMKENSESLRPDPQLVENEEDRKEKIAIVGSGNGGGFSDLLSRLNQSRSKETDLGKQEEEDHEEFEMIELPTRAAESEANQDPNPKSKGDRSIKKKKKKRECVEITEGNEKSRKLSLKRKKSQKSTQEEEEEKAKESMDQRRIEDHESDEKPRKRVRIDSNQNITHEEKVEIKKSKKDKKESKKDKKQSKTEKKESKKDKTHEKSNSRTSVNSNPQSSSINENEKKEDEPSKHLTISRPINPRMAARSKYIKSKKLATSLNATAMAEILGIHTT